MTADALGNIYFSDSFNNLVRVLLPGGDEQPLITTEGVVDAAGFGPRLAPDSIATAFVLNGASGDAVGNSSPLPTRLGGSILEMPGIHLTQVTPTSCSWAHSVLASQSATIERYGVGSTAMACCTRR